MLHDKFKAIKIKCLYTSSAAFISGRNGSNNDDRSGPRVINLSKKRVPPPLNYLRPFTSYYLNWGVCFIKRFSHEFTEQDKLTKLIDYSHIFLV